MVPSFDSVEVLPRKSRGNERPQSFLIERDGEPDLRFRGWLVAHAKTKPSRPGLINGALGEGSRWFEYKIYVTDGIVPSKSSEKGGLIQKIVAEKIGCSDLSGEFTRRQVYVCDSGAELVRKLGADREMKDLYRQAGLDIAEDLT